MVTHLLIMDILLAVYITFYCYELLPCALSVFCVIEVSDHYPKLCRSPVVLQPNDYREYRDYCTGAKASPNV